MTKTLPLCPFAIGRRAGRILGALLGILLPVLAGAHTLDVPATVHAQPDGSFTYEFTLTAGPGGTSVGSWGYYGVSNCSGAAIIDCFCSPGCVYEEGERLTETVSGTLNDPGQPGTVRLGLSLCDGTGPLPVDTTILPAVTGVGGDVTGSRDSGHLYVAPNPFRALTTITLDLPAPSPATLVIHDITGRRVRQLVAGEMLPAGKQQFVWDGRSDSGPRAPGGIYLVQGAAGNFRRMQKIVLLP